MIKGGICAAALLVLMSSADAQSPPADICTYVGNDPANRVDPSGERFEYVYQNGGTAEQVRQAHDYLANSPNYKGPHQIMENSSRVIRVTVDPSAENHSTRTGPNKEPGYTWNPTKQLETGSGDNQSPSVGMGHEEIGHVYRDFQNSAQFDQDVGAPSSTPNVDMNEEKATNASNAIAHDLGEPEQASYMDVNFANPEPITGNVTAHTFVPSPMVVTPEQPKPTGN